eukprot:9187467-Karenia_brevis.AAC.1
MTPTLDAAKNVGKRVADVAQNPKPSLFEAMVSDDRVASIKDVVEEATSRLGESFQQSVLGHCNKIEERMSAIDKRVDNMDMAWNAMGRNPAAASEPSEKCFSSNRIDGPKT